jgi:peroxiredoxin
MVPVLQLRPAGAGVVAAGNRGSWGCLVAISQQNAPNSRRSQRENGLGYSILIDKGGVVAARFGLRWNVPGYLREIHLRLGADLAQFNGEDSWTLPMPARYVIAPDATIAYAEINPDYTRRPEPSDLFPVLESIRQPADGIRA